MPRPDGSTDKSPMNYVDVNSSVRVSAMIELMNSIGRLADPRQLLEALASGIGESGRERPYVQLSRNGGGAGHYLITRLSSGNQQRLLVSSNSDEAGETIAASGGVLGQMIRTPVPKIAHELDLSDDPALPPAMRQCRSAMAMPIFSEQAAGEWVVLFDPDPHGFSLRELEELLVRSTLVGTLIGNLGITRQLFEANLRVQAEISGIAAIQQGLLPEQVPEIPGLRLAASYDSVGQSGGDMYDFLPLGRRPVYDHSQEDQRWAILIGDVSGHGPAAAMVMAMMHSILHAYPGSPSGPAEVLTHVNRHLCAKRIGRVYVTAFLGFYDPATLRLTYVRAGQTPPLLLPADPADTPQFLEEIGDVPLGIVSETSFTEGTLQLRPGQRLILYTDGITEIKSPAGEFFDNHGLLAAAREPGNAQDTLHAIQEAMLRHTGRSDADDDQTIVVAEVV